MYSSNMHLPILSVCSEALSIYCNILMDGIMREASVMRTTDRAEPMRCQNCLNLVT